MAGGTALRVMLMDDDPTRGARLEERLRVYGYESVLAVPAAGLLFQVEKSQPDVVLMDVGTPDSDMLESLAIIACHNPIPVVMFCREDVPDCVRQVVSAGIGICQVGGIVPEQVAAVIDMALAQFRAQQALRAELHTTRVQLEGRKLIDRAKKLLMAYRKLDEDAAHRLLTRLAMDSNRRLPVVARTVIDTLSPGSGRQD